MKLDCRISGDRLIASVTGELDQHSADMLRERLDWCLRDGEIRNIEFDLRGVSFMDSAGIGVILGRYKKLSARGGGMRVVNAQRSVEKVLRMSGVYKLCEDRRDR